MNILPTMNLSPLAQKWFENYLADRQQFTRVNNSDISILQVRCGVPQDCILGPLIFVAYVNNLPSVLVNSNTYLYADDTTTVVSGKDIAQINNKLLGELSVASMWLKEHMLTLNPSKTKVMYFGTQPKLANIDVNILQVENESIDVLTR